MSKLSLLLDTMLPTNAWHRVNSPANPHSPATYWALRIVLAIMVLLVFYLFDVHQHQGLR